MSKKSNVKPQERARWKEIGTIIRLARKAERPPMNMAQLGKVIHRSKGLIGQIERGEVNPRIHIEEIASALHHPITFFLPSGSSAHLHKLPKRASPHLAVVEGYIRVREAFINGARSDFPDIVRCWDCQRRPGSCTCWVQCPKCMRLHRRGTSCLNPMHYQNVNV